MPTWRGNNLSNYITEITVTQREQNIANNTTRISVVLYLKKLSGSGRFNTVETSGWNISINGLQGFIDTRNGAFTYDFRNYDSLRLFSGDFTIPHIADGTQTLTISTYTDPRDMNEVRLTNNMTLTPIPRASTLSNLPANFTIGQNITFTINRAVNTYTHTVYLRRPSDDTRIIQAAGLTTGGTLPTSVNAENQMYQWAANLTELPLGVRIITYNGSTMVGWRDYNIRAIVGADIIPSFSDIAVIEANADVSSKVGAYVQNNSRLTITINGAQGAKFSTIRTYRITVDNQVLNAQSGTTRTIQSSGTLNIIAKITDSRGRQATQQNQIKVIPYDFPHFNNSTTFKRVDASGIENPIGTSAAVDLDISASSLDTGGEKNKLYYKIESKDRDSTTWEVKVDKTDVGGLSGQISQILSTYPIDQVFDFRVSAIDIFNTSISLGILSLGSITMQWVDDGISVGKPYERGTVDAVGQMYQNNGTPVVSTHEDTNGYPGLLTENAADDQTLRSPKPGLFPYDNTGATSSLGSTSWRWANIFTNAMDILGNLIVSGRITSQTQTLAGSNVSDFITASTNQYMRYNNGILEQWGSVQVPIAIPGTPSNVVVNLVQPYIDTNYTIQVSPYTSVPGTAVLGVGAAPTATNRITVYVTRSNLTTTIVWWYVRGRWK